MTLPCSAYALNSLFCVGIQCRVSPGNSLAQVVCNSTDLPALLMITIIILYEIAPLLIPHKG